jgi:hypothetical protein
LRFHSWQQRVKKILLGILWNIICIVDLDWLIIQLLKRTKKSIQQMHDRSAFIPMTASCENTMTLSVPDVPASCEKFHTLVNWAFDLLNRFSISLACLWKHWMLFASVCNINTSGQRKESLGQTSQSLCSSISGRTNATSALSLGVA